MHRATVHVARFLHDEYGECVVLLTWKKEGRWWRLVPIGVEFDLFTPEGERERMLEELGLDTGRISC